MHIVAVTEFYVRMVEESRRAGFTITQFAAEPGCWWRDSSGTLLKPDAYIALRGPGYVDHWWIEIDLDTEHIAMVERQISAYLTFISRAEPGPNGAIPGVLLVAPTPERAAKLKNAVSRLDPSAGHHITVTTTSAAAGLIATRLYATNTPPPIPADER